MDSGSDQLFNKIIVCENSGFDLTLFSQAFRGSKTNICNVSVPMDDSKGSFGRGYSEMLLIDGAIRGCDAIEDSDLIWKLTGRYQVKNMKKIVARYQSSDVGLVVNMRRYPKKWADLYLFAFTSSTWRDIANRIDRFKTDSELAEIIMYELAEDLAQHRRLVDRFPAEPHVVGIRGYDQQQYDSGTQKLKRYIRQAVRVVAPSARI